MSVNEASNEQFRRSNGWDSPPRRSDGLPPAKRPCITTESHSNTLGSCANPIPLSPSLPPNGSSMAQFAAPSFKPKPALPVSRVITLNRSSRAGLGGITGFRFFDPSNPLASMPRPSVPLIRTDPLQPVTTHSNDIQSEQDDQKIDADGRVVKTMKLSLEQKEVLSLVIDQQKSVFITGNAGTGKSLVMQRIIARLKSKYPIHGQIAVTASTGMAACNIGGCTLHSFAGIQLGNGDANALLNLVRQSKKATIRWKTVKVLIIDEISMINSELFDKLDHIARIIRSNDRPFGGIQLVVCGDFMQLPPVSKKSSVSFCFESKAWKECVPLTIGLKKVFRQRDNGFITILNEIRCGKLSAGSIKILKSLSREPKYSDGIEPTLLMSLRKQVDDANQRKYNSLKGEEHVFEAQIYSKKDIKFDVASLFNAPKTLRLKEGAQVMLLKNMSGNLVNGSVGVVHSFDEITGFPLVEFDTSAYYKGADSVTENDAKYFRTKTLIEPQDWESRDADQRVVATMKQIPLALCYAMSIHKSQGQTLQRVKVDLNGVFEKGQAYVALSRAVSLEGLQVLNFSPDKVMTDPKVIEYHRKLFGES